MNQARGPAPARYDIGVDIGGTNIKLGLVDARGRIIARRRLLTHARRGPQQALDRIAAAVRGLSRGHKVTSVGVGVAGLVDHTHGIIRLPPNLPGWHGTAVKAAIERATGIQVHCANDVNVFTVGEWLFGKGRGHCHVLCLTLGTGVGGGIISHGRLLLGANDAAAEIGHMTIFGDGPVCRCGGRGCLERYVGAGYIVERMRAKLRAQKRRVKWHRRQMPMFDGIKVEQPSLLFDMLGRTLAGLTPRHIALAAARNDELALREIEETGFYLGLGISAAVALLDPELVIIGGGVAGFGRTLLRAARRTVFNRTPVFTGRRLELVLSDLGADAGILGASRLGWLSPTGFELSLLPPESGPARLDTRRRLRQPPPRQVRVF